MVRAHPSAVIDPAAEVADDVEIGPYCVIGPNATIGAGSVLHSHVMVGGRTTIGRNNRFFPFCAIGGLPQDKKYAGEDTELVIGDRNTIREFCTFNLGVPQAGGKTTVGDDNWIMATVHIAHDCQVGDHTILANNATLAGHVTIGDWVILGGMSAVHQFCAVGDHAMAAGGAIVLRDVPPYVICSGNPAEPHGINTEGLKRRGVDTETVNTLRRAYKTLYRDGLTVADAVTALDALCNEHPASAASIGVLKKFVQESQRGIIR
ncbi:MAG: acyl-ACP--UDP-N-acetylglucosamine O-acyltransferase [Burkholderiaceae bacterium]